MNTYNSSEVLRHLRQSKVYRFTSYATYLWWLLFLINYYLFVGTDKALLGGFIIVLLFLFYAGIGAHLGIYYERLRFLSSRKIKLDEVETDNKTNIIHDIGIIIYNCTWVYFLLHIFI